MIRFLRSTGREDALFRKLEKKYGVKVVAHHL